MNKNAEAHGRCSVCAILVLWTITAIASHAQSYVTLHVLGAADGNASIAELIQGTDGVLYGTTSRGPGYGGPGTVFKIALNDSFTTLHVFQFKGSYYSGPAASLVQATNGDFYGTSVQGGTYICANGYSCGELFRITGDSNYTVLHSFNGSDGQAPSAELIEGSDGCLYGTTPAGGASGGGTVFKVTLSGTLTVLYNFVGASGYDPEGGLVEGTDGSFYGTTYVGGDYSAGTIFKITSGGIFTSLHSFQISEGVNPDATLIQASDGDLYGTTQSTVFRITSDGTFTVLHTFNGSDGSSVYAGVVEGSDGNFYGTTNGGGSNNGCTSGCGTAFRITPAGGLTTLVNFGPGDTGSMRPTAGLVQDTNGNFYGVTYLGGAGGGGNCVAGCGVVYGISAGLTPFVRAQPHFGSSGITVRILGTKLTAATAVTFNGTPVGFQVVSPTLIKTVVPPGATTGYIEVTTPTGTLNSNVPFQVVP